VEDAAGAAFVSDPLAPQLLNKIAAMAADAATVTDSVARFL
jgi:hypothetical protein